ncbi:MAG: metallophosphoesterase [Acidaminobacteraceae bacterium]
MEKKIEKISINDNYRIVAISDIHGGYDKFERLIRDLDIKDDDYLIILGDVIEKGERSYDTFELCKELIKSKNVFYLKGNWEYAVEQVFANGELAQKILNYVKRVKYESILGTWTEKFGKKIDEFHDSNDLYEFLSGKLEDDLNIIKNLPLALEIDEFIFVHSGLGLRLDWENSSVDEMLINDEFNNSENLSGKFVVVGHWPTSNYRKNSLNSEIFINNSKKIISIDGGYSVKQTGQLNALIIEKENGDLSFSSMNTNDFYEMTYIRKNKFNELENMLINSQVVDVGWPNYNLLPIERIDLVTKCWKEETKQNFYIINELIGKKDEKYISSIDYLSDFLDIGDYEKVEVVRKYKDFSLVKYRCEFGWVLNENLVEI